MKPLILVLGLVLATLSFAPAPAAADAGPDSCLVGDRSCLVGVEWVVCVTDPCDPAIVCVAYGRYCIPVGPP